MLMNHACFLIYKIPRICKMLKIHCTARGAYITLMDACTVLLILLNCIKP